MKKFVFFLGLFVFGVGTSLASNQDSTLFQIGSYDVIRVARDQSIKVVSVSGKVKYENLKFFERGNRFYQVLDENNRMFYLNDELEEANGNHDFFGLCGTVPHYELTVKKEGDFFKIYSDETFYDWEGKEGPVVIDSIPLSNADQVLFMNGEEKFVYNSNYGIGHKIFNKPTALILVKDGKKGIRSMGMKTIWYDEVSLLGRNLLIGEKSGLYSVPIIDSMPEYTSIGPFKGHLAEFTLANGCSGYIDTKGNRYANPER